MRSIVFVILFALAPSAFAAPKVTVYGAEWCGPCQRVRAYLTSNRVAFDYVDIDQNHAAFEAVAGGKLSIPLIKVGSGQVRGADYAALASLLTREGILKSAVDLRVEGESYGGHSPAWWEQQFRALRMRVKMLGDRIKQLDRVAVDDQERGVVLPRMRRDLKVVEASLDQLELDASRASVPRQYRAY